jgi:hypothetical protein
MKYYRAFLAILAVVLLSACARNENAASTTAQPESTVAPASASPEASESPSSVSEASPEAAASGGGSAASSASNSPYPDWATAAVPEYPNVIDQMLGDDFYQIMSADDAASVLAWYRSRVPGAWATPASPDNWVLPSAKGVRIEIDKIGYGNQPVGKRPKTIIYLYRIVNGQVQPH